MTGPVNAQGLEMDQESIEIALVYVSVCEGDVGRLDCRFVLLHSVFYILYTTIAMFGQRQFVGSYETNLVDTTHLAR